MKIAEEVEVWGNAGKSFAPVDESGDYATGVGIDVYGVKAIEIEKTNNKRVKRKTHPTLEERSKHQHFIWAGFEWNTLPKGAAPFTDDAGWDQTRCLHHLQVSLADSGAPPCCAGTGDDIHVDRSIWIYQPFLLSSFLGPASRLCAFLGSHLITKSSEGRLQSRARGLAVLSAEEGGAVV